MSELDRELIGYALEQAKKHGYRYVKLKSGDSSFKATLGEFESDDDDDLGEVSAEIADHIPSGPSTHDIPSPVVGYFRPTKERIAIGSKIEQGQVIGEIVALGLANEVTSKYSGEVIEILVEEGQPVEYGQAIARIQQ